MKIKAIEKATYLTPEGAIRIQGGMRPPKTQKNTSRINNAKATNNISGPAIIRCDIRETETQTYRTYRAETRNH